MEVGKEPGREVLWIRDGVSDVLSDGFPFTRPARPTLGPRFCVLGALDPVRRDRGRSLVCRENPQRHSRTFLHVFYRPFVIHVLLTNNNNSKLFLTSFCSEEKIVDESEIWTSKKYNHSTELYNVS